MLFQWLGIFALCILRWHLNVYMNRFVILYLVFVFSMKLCVLFCLERHLFDIAAILEQVMVSDASVIGKRRFSTYTFGEHFKASSSAPRDYPENHYQGQFLSGL